MRYYVWTEKMEVIHRKLNFIPIFQHIKTLINTVQQTNLVSPQYLLILDSFFCMSVTNNLMPD